MIYGLVANWQKDKRKYPAVFEQAFAFLDQHDVTTLAVGKYPIDGDTIFASVQTLRTQDEEVVSYEAHAKYLDIQIVVAGREKYLASPNLDGVSITENFLEERDVAYYTRPASHCSFIVDPGQYVVFFPGELHCPCCAATPGGEDIRKVVLKIRWTD
jgi:uncharacterized protein, YhcH/YjgK/YiaL family